MIEHKIPRGVFLVSKTDTRGTIVYANPAFIKISGYTEQELIGQPHNKVRHPDMPKAVFKLLWKTLQAGQEFWGYVKNRSKDGGYYWVYAHVTPTFSNTDGNIIGYHSDRRPADPQKLAVIEPIYQTLLQAESSGGVTAGVQALETFLKEKGMSYEEFIFSL